MFSVGWSGSKGPLALCAARLPPPGWKSVADGVVPPVELALTGAAP
jgi:hypothetical protein